MPDTRDMRKIMELQSLAGMERFSKRTIAEELKRHKLIELLKNGGVRDFPFNAVLADHLIAHGVTVQEWISVKDRLPEYADGHVLVTDGMRVKISCRNACYKTASGETRCAQDYGAGMCVTHWMPLPQPPKGE